MLRGRIWCAFALMVSATIVLRGQDHLVGWLDRAIKAAGVPIAGVSISDPNDKATWKVSPSSLQGAAQPTIDAFNGADPAYLTTDLDLQAKADLDTARLYSAIVWAVIDTYSAPATKAKYAAARLKIIAAYQAQPWK